MHEQIKSICAYDLDGTLIKGNCSNAFSQFLYKKGVFDLKARLYCLFIVFRYLYFGMDLTTVHKQVFDVLFKGKPLKLFMDQAIEFIEHHFDRMINRLVFHRLCLERKLGHHILLLSSSPSFLVKPIAQRLQIDEYRSTEYEADEQGFLLKISTLVNGPEKVRFLNDFAKKLNISKDHIFAYSDSIDDLPFLKAAGHPTCVKPDRKLKSVCEKMRWNLIDT